MPRGRKSKTASKQILVGQAVPTDPPLGFFVEEFIPYLLGQINNITKQRFKGALRKSGLSLSQWRVVAVLNASSHDLSLADLMAATAIDQPTLSRIVDQLVEKGLVHRAPRQTDGRFISINLTDQGRGAFSRIWPIALKHGDDMVADLEPAEIEQFRATLKRMIQTLVRLS